MEKDTVILSIEEYNELRDLRTKILDGKCLVVNTSYGNYGYNSSINRLYYTENEILEELNLKIKNLLKINGELRDEIHNLKSTNGNLKEMSYYKFYKWRKK